MTHAPITLCLCALALLLPAAAGAAGDVPAGASGGTTIVGERETAVGLYLMPWQEEAPSDIDRPPQFFDQPQQAIDATAFHARVEADAANAAYRRVRVEPRW
ncbi:MAG: hypothetical protein ACREVL_03920 [Solimonas sp.]